MTVRMSGAISVILLHNFYNLQEVRYAQTCEAVAGMLVELFSSG